MNTFGIKFDHDCLIFQNFLLNLKLEDNTTNEDCIKRLGLYINITFNLFFAITLKIFT